MSGGVGGGGLCDRPLSRFWWASPPSSPAGGEGWDEVGCRHTKLVAYPEPGG